MRTTLLLLLTVCCGWGQAFTHNDLPWLTSAAPDPLVQNLAYWWVYTDISSNASVTSWPDRIQGVILTNGASGNRPTNSFNGVWTDESHWLTNISLLDVTNVGNISINFVIFIANQGDSPYQLQPALYTSGSENIGAGGGYGFYDTGSNPHGLSRLTAPIWRSYGSSSFQGTNRWIDILYNDSTTVTAAYTNGVLVQSQTYSVPPEKYWQSGNGLGTDSNGEITKPDSLRYLGRNIARASGPRLFWKEIRIYTNFLVSTTITALHQNAVNNFGVSP